MTRAALVLSALVFQRPGNVRAAEWGEIDLEAATWTVPSAKIKRTVQGKLSGRPHLMPLSTQAVAELRELRKLTGHGAFVFPSLLTGERCMSENTVNTALRRMGYGKTEMTAHGVRAMARTILVEELNLHPDVIEAQLAHGKSGPLGAAYDRAEFMEQRRLMMQTWADYLDKLRAGARRDPNEGRVIACGIDANVSAKLKCRANHVGRRLERFGVRPVHARACARSSPAPSCQTSCGRPAEMFIQARSSHDRVGRLSRM